MGAWRTKAILRCVPFGVLACAAACSWTTSLDGLTGGAPAPDGLVDASDGSLTDGASNRVDGGGDGSVVAFTCKSAPPTATLCEDFDTAPLPGAFSVSKTKGGGAVMIADQGRSAPNTALFSINADSDDSAAALIRQVLPVVTKTAVIELDLRVDSTGTEAFDVVTFSSNPPEVGFQIEGSGALTWDENVVAATSIDTPSGLAIAMGSWTHVRLSFLIEGDLAKATLSVDGGVLATAMHTFQAKALRQGANLVIGDDSIQPSATPWRVRVDNVILTIE